MLLVTTFAGCSIAVIFSFDGDMPLYGYYIWSNDYMNISSYDYMKCQSDPGGAPPGTHLVDEPPGKVIHRELMRNRPITLLA